MIRTLESCIFMNQTATFIFDLCDGSNTKDAIVRRLTDIYAVDPDKAEKNMEDILKQLCEDLDIESLCIGGKLSIRHLSGRCQTKGHLKKVYVSHNEYRKGGGWLAPPVIRYRYESAG